MNDAVTLLRHTVATLAYRGGKALRGAPPQFGSFQASATTRTPLQILAHVGDLFDWAVALADGQDVWHDSPPLPWDQETARFFSTLAAFDRRLSQDSALACPAEKLFQGPVADALTHIGQIAMLRRLAGSPVPGENYYKADIVVGRVGAEQSKPSFEFD